MLEAGSEAPDFEGTTATGTRLKLSSLRGRPVVLYFYPKAGTLGCTAEARSFADYYPALRERGVEVVGVSVDDVARQGAFAQKCSVPFPLVADADRSIARRFGVLGAFGVARRVTFLLDADGRVMRVVESVLPGRHVAEAREAFLAGPAVGDARDRPPV